MSSSPIRSWGALYEFLGYPEPEDPELTRAVIITFFIAPHQNPVIASENFFVRIRLHSHLSAAPVRHFGEVTTAHTATANFSDAELLVLPRLAAMQMSHRAKCKRRGERGKHE